ncbi:MAG: hypothetical protein R3B06_03215 [Kofleriaceae bacterium]
MDARLRPRRRWGDVQVTGARRAVREGLRVLVLVVAASAALGYLLEPEYDRLYYAPVVALVALAALQLRARPRALVPGLLAGAVTLAGAYMVTALMAASHQDAELTVARSSRLSFIVLGVLGGAQIVLELIVSWRERRHLAGAATTMDARLGPRRRLNDVRLTGTRRGVRDGLRVAVLVVAAGAALAYLTSTHALGQNDPVTTHAAIDDLGVVPLVALAAIVGLQLLAWGNSLTARVAVGLVTLVVAFGVTGLMALTHMFTYAEGEDAGLATFALLSLLGGGQIFVEPLAAWRERRLLDRADPRLARAVVRA